MLRRDKPDDVAEFAARWSRPWPGAGRIRPPIMQLWSCGLLRPADESSEGKLIALGCVVAGSDPPTRRGLPPSRNGDRERMLEERKRRIGENETRFREVNELVRPLDQDVMTVLCECGDPACRDQLLIAHDEYARLREDPTLFVLRPGHEFDETEQIEAKHIEYWVVRKRPGLPAQIAREAAPT